MGDRVEEDGRRVAKIRLDPQMVASLLDLPDGYEVIGVHGTFDPPSVEVIVSGEGLPVTPWNVEAQIAHGTIHTQETDDGIRIKALSWEWPEQTCPGGC